MPQAAVWQLDFCSRPVLDERGKKKWELIICDEKRRFEFARFFSNNQINSTQVGRWVWISAITPGASCPLPVRESGC